MTGSRCLAAFAAGLLSLCAGCATPGSFHQIPNPGWATNSQVATVIIANNGGDRAMIDLSHSAAKRYHLAEELPPGAQMIYTVPAGDYTASTRGVAKSVLTEQSSQNIKLEKGACYEWLVGNTSR